MEMMEKAKERKRAKPNTEYTDEKPKMEKLFHKMFVFKIIVGKLSIHSVFHKFLQMKMSKF